MGLDNGIVLKIKNKSKFGKLPAWVEVRDYGAGDEVEMCYWRKCWNIRDVIFAHLHENKADMSNEYHIPMSIEMFVSLCTKLMDCYTKEWWDEHDTSIWDAEEMIDGPYRNNLLYAMRLVGWLENIDPSAYVIEFYDSY